jgi:ribulose-bisphosphate carboxylase large chain
LWPWAAASLRPPAPASARANPVFHRPFSCTGTEDGEVCLDVAQNFNPAYHMTFSPAVSLMTAERFTVTYRITPDDSRPVEQHAKDITIEETVEIPPDCVPDSLWDAGIVGQIESITPVAGEPNTFDVPISYRVDITNNDIPNLLNVLFGNISIRRGIKVIDVAFTESQFKAFGGPRIGIDGIRSVLGVQGRPLATTAIKPLGLSAKDLAARCGGYAAGGLDIIKDDHGLIDQHFHPFEERVSRIMDAIRAGNARTGTKTLYYPTLSGPFEKVARQAEHAHKEGCFGMLIHPMLIGPDTGFSLCRKHGLSVMAHPTFSGTHFHDPRHGMTPAVLLGSLFRLFGADVSVFPNYGGRFTFSKQECLDLARSLRESFGNLKSAFPSPAGGMTIERVGDMIDVYGNDTALLIGGALIKADPDPEVAARRFVESIERAVANRIGGKT